MSTEGFSHRFFFWYFSKKSLPYWCILLLDCICVFFSIILSYMFYDGVTKTASVFVNLCGTVAIYLIFYIISFRLLHTYSGVLRYSSFVDLGRIAAAMAYGLAASLILKFAVGNRTWMLEVRARDIILGSVVALLMMWVYRVLAKYLYDNLYIVKGAERAFILGMREGGISIAKSLRNQDPAKYILAGFVTNMPGMDNRHLMGVRSWPFDTNLARIMKHERATTLFVSPMRSEDLRESPEITDSLIRAGIKIFMVPAEQQWDGKSDILHQQMREVSIEDLLPREQIQVDMASIGKLLMGKRVLVTGAAGSIGSEIVRQVASFGPDELILIDQAETPMHDVRLFMAREYPSISANTIVADIAQKRRMEEIFAKHRPHYVFHAAAYKHVPMMEDNPGEAIRNNVDGTRIIADLSVKYSVDKFVMVSTDKAVNPTNVMGCSKRICEIYVQSLDQAEKAGKIQGKTQFVTTRFGNVLGSNGSVIPLFKEQIRRGGPITVTHPDIIRYFMLIPEACKLVLEAGTMGNGGEIFVFDMGKPVKIVDLAKRMIDLSGTKCEIKFTGLRDGEKLYEEVLNEKETTLPTFHPKIKIAKVRIYDYDTASAEIDELIEHSHDDHIEVVGRMKALVPEFRSQHSVYEQLDKPQ